MATSLASRRDDLRRIALALKAASEVVGSIQPNTLRVDFKSEGSPVTAVDHAINEQLRQRLVRGDEGWLSEETADEPSRLAKRRAWVVDPLDGTKEFIQGIPEWCISVGLVEDGQAVAGGIYNPATGELFLGSRETGVTLNGKPVRQRTCRELKDAIVLASRSEMGRGEWDRFDDGPFVIRPLGSVAYKLAYVAAGLAEATWTLLPKHEWDVAAGVALVTAAGGTVKTLPNVSPRFNRAEPRFHGLAAFSRGSEDLFQNLLKEFQE